MFAFGELQVKFAFGKLHLSSTSYIRLWRVTFTFGKLQVVIDVTGKVNLQLAESKCNL